jgi:hypothetical protein
MMAIDLFTFLLLSGSRVAEHFGAVSTSCAVKVVELLCIVSTGSLEKYCPFQDECFSLSFRQTGNAHPSTGNGQCSYHSASIVVVLIIT